jgi:hypothetical protein
MRLALLALLAAACSSVSTSHDYDLAYDFGKLKRYQWAKRTGADEGNPLIVQRVRAAVDAQLAAKGYARADSGADFLVAAYTGRQSRIQVTDWGYGYGPYGRWYGGPVDVYEYEEGSLILDVVDAPSKKLVWRGAATAIIDPDATPEERTKRINEAIAKVLAKFPPSK